MSEPVKEGSRWRYAQPTSDELAAWFDTQRLDEGMDHEDYIGGVVLIKSSEKVKKAKADGKGSEEEWENLYTPYVRVDTRIAYFNRLAELHDLIAVKGAIQVPRSNQPAFDNRHMAEGFWWLVMGAQESARRFLCCTMRVALYDKRDYLQGKAVPLREGLATKAVDGSPDVDAPAKAETGAIGRALGMAGILVVGSGIATAEDMQELGQPRQAGATLPDPGAGEEPAEAVNERLLALQGQLKPHGEQWREFTAWWSERATAAGWKSLNDAPAEVRRGMVSKMTGLLAEAEANVSADPALPPPDDSSLVDTETAGGTP